MGWQGLAEGSTGLGVVRSPGRSAEVSRYSVCGRSDEWRCNVRHCYWKRPPGLSKMTWELMGERQTSQKPSHPGKSVATFGLCSFLRSKEESGLVSTFYFGCLEDAQCSCGTILSAYVCMGSFPWHHVLTTETSKSEEHSCAILAFAAAGVGLEASKLQR